MRDTKEWQGKREITMLYSDFNEKFQMKKAFVIILLVLDSFFFVDNTLASPIADSWVYATIRIENEWGKQGTGFLVSRAVDANNIKVFLCTNKHVLNRDEKKRQVATKIICHLNETNKDSKIVGVKHELPLALSNGTKRWKEHPNKDVDVLVFNITDLINERPNMIKKWVNYDLFVDKDTLSKHDITIADEVLVLGYPSIIPKLKSNFPIVRQGIIASQIGEKYVDEYEKRKRVLRGFLVDGGMIPGSSGSPVILKPVSGRIVNNTIVMGLAKPYLLGIIAETRYSSIRPIPTKKSSILSYAGLGFAFDASTVKETIELFFEERKPKK